MKDPNIYPGDEIIPDPLIKLTHQIEVEALKLEDDTASRDRLEKLEKEFELIHNTGRKRIAT